MPLKLLWPLLLITLTVSACKRSPSKEVVVYTSVDEPVARPILDDFTRKTGIKVILKTDTEASKTAGLVETLRAEKSNPQCDVFWNNEIFHTINLAREGILASYDSPAAGDALPQYRDPNYQWSANGLRMRMIALAPTLQDIQSIEDLTNPRFKNKIALANPAFGTTSGHLAALYLKWGPQKYEQFLRDLKTNQAHLLGGNSEVVKQIAAGNIQAGLTDNDDVDSMQKEGGKLTAIPADTKDHAGALAIPCTLALIQNAKHAAEARQLIDYLLSREVEDRLLQEHFAARSVRPQPSSQPSVPLMQIDYVEAAKMLPRAVATARKILEGRE